MHADLFQTMIFNSVVYVKSYVMILCIVNTMMLGLKLLEDLKALFTPRTIIITGSHQGKPKRHAAKALSLGFAELNFAHFTKSEVFHYGYLQYV